MDKLIVEGHNIEYQNLQEQERITDAVIEETDAQTLLSNESQRDELITLLREETTLEGRERTANTPAYHNVLQQIEYSLSTLLSYTSMFHLKL